MHSSVVRPGMIGRRDAAVAAGLAFLTFVVFLRALDCGFINFDDRTYVTNNRYVTKGLTLEDARWAFTTYSTTYWQPLTWLSLQLDASLSWPNPRGFLLTNVLLHAVNAALLFLALRLLTGAFGRSAAAALLFAVHPLRVESIAWVTERKDVLSGFFGLLALCAYAAYANRPSARRYLAMATAYALSLMAKPMLVTLPGLLLVLDWWPLRRFSPVELLRAGRTGRAAWLPVLEKLPLLVLAVASAAVTLQSDTAAGRWAGLSQLTLAGRVENATVSYAIYLLDTVWPVNLAIYYPHPLLAYNHLDHLPAAQVVGAALLLVAATWAAVVLRKRAPYFLTGWVWYLMALLPVIGLVQSGPQGHADRFTYFPHIGILLAVCWGVADLTAGRARLALGPGALATAVLAIMAWNQLSYWRDPETIWRHALEVTGPNPIALQNLAECVKDAEAAGYCRMAIDIDPAGADAGVSSDGHMMLANIYLRAGRLDDATRELEEAIRIKPSFDGAYANLGIIESRRGRYDRAADCYREQLRARDSSLGHCNLGAALNYQGKLADAENEFREAIRLDPEFVPAHANLGGLLYREQRLDEAALEEEKAIELEPRTYEAHYQLGLIETDRAHYARAVECFQQALRLRPDSLDALSGMGVPLLQQGRINEALTVMTQVVRGRPQSGPAHFNLGKALELRGDLDGAAGQYLAATRLDPGLAQAWYDLGRLHARQGRHSEAIASFEQAVSHDASSKEYREALEAARQPQNRTSTGGSPSAPR